MTALKLICSLFILSLFPGMCFADISVKSPPKIDKDGFEIIDEGPSRDQLQAINTKYMEKIKPIFQNKCLPCHRGTTNFPWYHAIPGVKQLIDHDVKEAKERMDMSNDFPFKGHGAPKEDLKALTDEVQSGEMPPMRYRVMHWDSGLTKEEKQIILDWVTDANKILDTRQY